MGYVSYFFAETKTVELLIEAGYLGLCIIKRSRGVSQAVVLGKSSVVWLLATVEVVLKGDNLGVL
jgi:hypothetical protein